MVDEPIQEQNYSISSSASRDIISFENDVVLQDINLNDLRAPNTPLNIGSPKVLTSIQKPSPLILTPPYIEPLFSIVTNEPSNSIDNTPLPSPYCDFSETSQSLSDTLVPTCCQDIEDTTLTTEVGMSAQEDFSGAQMNNGLINNTDSVSAISTPCNSISSPAIFSNSDYSAASTPKNNTRRSKKRTDVGLKRLKLEDEWIVRKRKRLCNKGMEYTTSKGKTKAARSIKSSCVNCRLQCYNKISQEVRIDLFNKFWGTGNHAKQWQIIAKYVIQKNKKTATNVENESSRRSHTLHYHLPLNSDSGIILEKVCKTMFLNTFNISKDFVYTAIRKNLINNDFADVTDDRGRHKNHKFIISNDMKQNVIDHVNSFTPVESHYVRKRSSKKYLDPSLSFTKMFKLYVDWCTDNNFNVRVQTVRQYRDIVNSNLKIGFHLPKKDQCDLCHQYKNTSTPTDELKEKFTKHQTEKEISRKLKLECKLLAVSNNEVSCVVFDFQKVLCAPYGNTSVYYYRRKLNVYNFTIYSMESKEAFCYMWDEQTAKRGANEVASCLYDYFNKLASKGVHKVNLWSDNCGGQNRNRIVYYMYLLATKMFEMKISHHFMEKGHTQNEGDSVHALIEKTARGRDIYSPDEWYSLVRWAKVNGNPYNVVEVNQNMIFDFKSNINNKNWTKNLNNEKIMWNKIKNIEVSPESYGLLDYKYSLGDNESNQLQCFKKTSTRLSHLESFPEKAYKSLLKINVAKYKDLKYYCDNNIIPEKYHTFYRNILTTENDEENGSDDED